ncbi:MAG: acetyl-CoA carboxylase biotin carboxyl carrier protein [Armatimonadota bacterium]
MDVGKIEELIKVLENSRTEELSVRKGGFAVHIVKGKKAKPVASAKKAAKVAEARSDVPDTNDGEFYILAPMVGIFHGVDGIAKVGSILTKGQVVGSIESMKLLNDVVSEVSGNVIEAMVEDGTPVEYGQPLCKIEAA